MSKLYALPINAGEVGRLAPMAVKLKGEIATTYPSCKM
jgi:hypothetical protein